MKDKNFNISSLKQDFKNLRHTFLAHRNRSTMQQIFFFLAQEAGAFRNNIEKKPQKSCPKLKNMYVTYLNIIFALSAIQCKW